MQLGLVFFLLCLMSDFNKITVLGPGLLGGSIALAIQNLYPEVDLCLWGRRAEAVEAAKSIGIPNSYTDIEEASAGADLLILATPVGVMPHVVSKIKLTQDMIVTDVGSVKRKVYQSLAPFFDNSDAVFIGSHPMAGSEKTGILAAKEDLVRGAACIVTNDFNCEKHVEDKVVRFWQGLGMRTRLLNAEDHDYAVARISHFPHMLASIGATVGLRFEDIAELSGGGMRDTTRVAAGDPDLWTEILLENADALQRSLGECREELQRVQDILSVRDEAQLKKYLVKAKSKRDII